MDGIADIELAERTARPGASAWERLQNVAAPLAALIYPWLVALGPSLHPALLTTSMVVPIIGFWMAIRIDPEHFPAARRIAFLTIGAPALFSFLGGWLDGQQLLPRGLPAWWMIWIALTALALFVQRHASAGESLQQMIAPGAFAKLRTAHGISAAAILLFAVFHLANHLAGLLGGEVHRAIMEVLRAGYRHPLVEVLLIACVAFQIASGAMLLWRSTGIRRDLPATLQAASGLYLLCFFASHISAVFRTRYLHGTDTDWRWLTSSPLLTDEWGARLVPYYWLGVVALGVHGAAGLRHILLAHGIRQSRADAAFAGASIAALAAASLIMTGLVLGSHGWRL